METMTQAEVLKDQADTAAGMSRMFIGHAVNAYARGDIEHGDTQARCAEAEAALWVRTTIDIALSER